MREIRSGVEWSLWKLIKLAEVSLILAAQSARLDPQKKKHTSHKNPTDYNIKRITQTK